MGEAKCSEAEVRCGQGRFGAAWSDVVSGSVRHHPNHTRVYQAKIRCMGRRAMRKERNGMGFIIILVAIQITDAIK